MTRIHAALFTLALSALAASLPARAQPVDGEVTRIDRAQQRVTLKHGAIRNLDLPAMAMTFRLADASWLTRLKVGDKVRFEAAKVEGYYTITRLEGR
jgi:Cu/Ag efflux protein CusF